MAQTKEEIKAYQAAYYASHREERKAYYAAHQVMRAYGITLEDKQAMIDVQGGACAICSAVLADLSKANVDHDHATGKLRGVLCHDCNVALGLLGDDVVTLVKAARYVYAKLVN